MKMYMKRRMRLLSLLCCFVLLLTVFTACTPKQPSDTNSTSSPDGTTASSTTVFDVGNSGTTVGGGKTTVSQSTPTSGTSSSGTSKPADAGTIIPAGYGTNAWKPFGTAKVFTDKAINTNFNAHAATSLKTVNGRTRFYVNGKEDAPIMYFGAFQSGRTDTVMSSVGHVLDAGANYIIVDVHINVTNTRVKKLTARMLNELIDHIEVYHAEKINGVKTQRLVIYYNCIGSIDIPEDVPIALPEVKMQTRKGVMVSYQPAAVPEAI